MSILVMIIITRIYSRVHFFTSLFSLALSFDVLKGQLKDYSKSAIGQVVITFKKDQLRNL